MSTNTTDVNSVQPTVNLSADDESAILAAIDGIRQKLPFLVDLTPAERQGLAKLGDKTHAFVMKAVDVAIQNPGVLPASHSVDDVRRVTDAFQGLLAVRMALTHLHKQVNDTTAKLGSDAYALARTIYVVTKSPIAKPALATEAQNLGRRFQRRPKAAAPIVPPPTPPPTL